MRSLWGPFVAALSLLLPSSAWSEPIDLVNDGFGDQGDAAFQQGFVSNEAAEVTLGPVEGTFTVQSVRFLYGPEAADTSVRLEIFVDDEGAAVPGDLLYSADYSIMPGDNVLHEIDVSAEGITHEGPGSIRVALLAMHDGSPGVARDADGCTPGRNWIRLNTPDWVDACEQGVEGDWVIRATVDGPVSMGTGGMGGSGAGAAGGSAEAGGGQGGSGGAASGGGDQGGAGGSTSGESGGCDCATPRGEQGPSALVGLALALAVWGRKRSARSGQ